MWYMCKLDRLELQIISSYIYIYMNNCLCLTYLWRERQEGAVGRLREENERGLVRDVPKGRDGTRREDSSILKKKCRSPAIEHPP